VKLELLNDYYKGNPYRVKIFQYHFEIEGLCSWKLASHQTREREIIPHFVESDL